MSKITVRHETVSRLDGIVKAHNLKIAKLNKRCGLDLKPASYTVLSTTVLELPQFVSEEFSWPKGTVLCELEISGDAARVAGYTVVGILTATDVGFLVSKALNAALLKHPKAYIDRGGDCDHCHTKRLRNTTYILRSKDGAESIVGSSCVADFVKSGSVQGAVAYADMMASLADEVDSMEEDDRASFRSGVRVQSTMGLRDFLAFVRANIRQHGWMPRSKAYDVNGRVIAPPTSQRAWESIGAAHRYLAFLATGKPEVEEQTGRLALEVVDFRNTAQPTEEDFSLAAGDIEIAEAKLEALESPSDYESNLLLVVRQGVVFGRNSGLAASITMYANRERDHQQRSKFPEKNEFFGEIGKRDVYSLKVIYTTNIESQWGNSQLCILVDSEGRRAKWFNTSKKELEKGTTYETRATVKKHDTYQGKNVTVLSRCSIVKEIAEGVLDSKAELPF